MTNKEVYDFYSALQGVQVDQHMPAKVAYAIIRNEHLTEPIVRSIDVARNGMIEKYCDPTPDEQGRYFVKEEFKEQFNKEIDELLAVENDIYLYMINLSDLEEVSLSLAEMRALYPMISEEV